jgi:hypothetical protein
VKLITTVNNALAADVTVPTVDVRDNLQVTG